MEQRFMRVRKQLDDLGYMQVLIPESIPLVEKLTSDLIQTTESLQKYKTIAKDALEERNNLELGAEPYKCDNAKLVKECNDLHLAFLQFRERNEKLQKDLKRRIASLEKEKLECYTDCEKLKRRTRDLEFESAKKTDRILTFQNKNLQTGGKTTAKSTSTAASKSRSSVSSKSNVELSTTMARANQKVADLTTEIKKLKDEKLQLIDSNESYKNQINNRDREITRLNQMLEGGRPAMALNKDCCYKDVETKMCRVQSEIGVLEKEKGDLEARLKESVAKQHEAMQRALHLAEHNKQLEQELRAIDQMALAVEADCNTTVKHNAHKVQRLQAKAHDSILQMQNLEREVAELKREKQMLQSDLDGLKLEKKHLQSVLETALNDKKRLNDRINQFTIIENDLNLEIDRLVQISANQKRKIAELECRILTEKFDAVSERSVVIAPGMEHYKSERDYYMKEYQALLEQTKNVPTKPDNDVEFQKKIKELELVIATLQHENKSLSQEKHNLMTRLETVRDSMENYDSLSIKSIIKRGERECEVLRGDIVRLEEERDALRQRLKVATESQVAEHARMEKTLMEADEQIRKVEQERRDLLQNQGSRRATITGLEEQCQCLKDQLCMNQNELGHQKALYGQLKTLHEHTDKALADSQAQLNQIETDTEKYQNRIRTLETERGQLDQEVATLKTDIMVMKGNLAQLDQEKDSLLISLDDKTERIAALEQELHAKDNKMITLENNLAELKQKLNLTINSSSSRDNLLKNANAETMNLRAELDTFTRAKDNALAENRRLQNDMASLSADSRSARSELELAKRQIEDLKRQLQQYVAEVKRFEDLMSHKDVERSELLDQFRSLSQEAVLLENNNHSLEDEAAQSKMELSVTLEHVTDLEDKLNTQDNMIGRYEKQITDLTAQVANLESQLYQCKQQQESTAQDLVSVRDLCMKLDKQKDSLMRELHLKDDERSQVDRDILRLRRESDTLQGTLVQDRSAIQNLEKLLAEARNEAVQLQLINNELKSEIQTLKQKLDETQTRVSSTSEQLDFYQERALDYSQQNKQLRRDIANERFFRAKEEEGKKYPSL